MRHHAAKAAKWGTIGFASFVFFDAGSKEWSVRHTWETALKQYALYAFMRIAGRRQLQQLIADAENGEEVQRSLLSEFLQRHQNTLYGRSQGLQGVVTLDIFRRSHPITHHGHYADYIQRIREGQQDVMAPGRPKMLAMTSGTSGSPKLVPHTEEISKVFFQRGVIAAFGVLDEAFPGSVNELQRSTKLTFRTEQREIEHGLAVGSNSANPDTRGFQSMLFAYASPKAAYDLRSEQDAFYAHALFALKDKNLGIIEANFAPLVCMMFDAMKENRRSLAQDLRNGHIWDRRLPDEVPENADRSAIDAALGGPDGPRAREVEKLIKAGATASELWPNLRVVMVTDSGSFQASASRLKELLGDVEIYSPFYAATEGLLGINIFPQRPFGVSTYLLDPQSMFFELLPVSYRSVENPPADAPIPAWEAQVGESYEIIVTTRGGFCRYRLGDIVRVVAMFGKMPVIAVEERALHFLPSLHGERVAEAVFLKALAEAPISKRIRGAAIVDEPGKLSGARYHIFVEPDEPAKTTDFRSDEQSLDEALCKEHEVYASFRSKGAIQAMKLHCVKPGTFAALRPVLAKKDGELPPVGGSQVKIPSVLRGAAASRLLEAELTA